jgi:exopolysaccharide production protein ExoZ
VESSWQLNKHLTSLHYLRGLAALMVLVFHGIGKMCQDTCGYDALGSFGVDIFFVISGFVMWSSTAGRDVTMLEFLTRRFFRIAPLYSIVTMLTVLVALAAPSILKSTTFDFRHVMDSLLFLPSLHPVLGTALPIVIPGWTLNFEMFFYTVFASILVLPNTMRLIVVVATITGIVALGAIFQPEELYTKFYSNAIILNFSYGVLIAELIATPGSSVVRGSVWAAATVASIGFATGIVPLPSLDFQLYFGLLAALIVWTTCEIDSRVKVPSIRFLNWIGDASYSIYLLQMATIAVCAVVWKRVGLPVETSMIVPFALAVISFTLICSYFTHRFIEVPMQKRGSQYAKWIGAKERAMNEHVGSPTA